MRKEGRGGEGERRRRDRGAARLWLRRAAGPLSARCEFREARAAVPERTAPLRPDSRETELCQFTASTRRARAPVQPGAWSSELYGANRYVWMAGLGTVDTSACPRCWSWKPTGLSPQLSTTADTWPSGLRAAVACKPSWPEHVP